MATQHRHETGIIEKLSAGLLTLLVGSFEGGLAGIEDGARDFERPFAEIVLVLIVRTSFLMRAPSCARAVHKSCHLLRRPFCNEHSLWGSLGRVSTAPRLPALLCEVCIETGNDVDGLRRVVDEPSEARRAAALEIFAGLAKC